MAVSDPVKLDLPALTDLAISRFFRCVSVLSAPARPSFYAFFFLPGLVPARTFRAFSISRSDQSRTFTVPTAIRRGAWIVPAAIWRWSVRIVRPSFLAAWRVEYLGFTMYLILGFYVTVKPLQNTVANRTGERERKGENQGECRILRTNQIAKKHPF